MAARLPPVVPDSATLRRALGTKVALELLPLRSQPAVDFADDAVVYVRTGEVVLAVAVPAALAVRLCLRVLGAEDELFAPRPLTRAEQGVLVYIVLSALGLGGSDARVDPAARIEGPVVVVPIRLHAGELWGEVRVLVPEGIAHSAPRAVSEDEWLARAERRLGGLGVELPVELAATRIGAQALGRLGVGDVVAFPRGRRPRLRIGRGGFRVREPEWRVTSDYEVDMSRNILMEELAVELTIELGRVRMSARQVLELAPGAVVELGKPLGGPVDLVAGGRVIARGELCDVDGQLGVRVTELCESA